jgi:hypothetical protein
MNEHAIAREFLYTSISRFQAVKKLGDGAVAQLSDEDLRWVSDVQGNSIAVIIQHLHGNMLSRWTDFLTSDGEKDWRDRDGEFEQNDSITKHELMQKWEEGWQCVFDAVEALQPDDLMNDVTIRGEAQSVIHAIQRQISHYSYHVGQIVFLARMRRGEQWQTLSVARGQSKQYQPQKD